MEPKTPTLRRSKRARSVSPNPTMHALARKKREEPKPLLFNQPSSQHFVASRLQSLDDWGGFFISGRVVVERNRNRAERREAFSPLRRPLRTHQGRSLAAVLVEPEHRPGAFDEDELFCGIAPFEPEEEGFLETLPEEPFRFSSTLRGAAGITDQAPAFVERENDASRHASLTGEESHTELFGRLCGDASRLDHGVFRVHVFQGECERPVLLRRRRCDRFRRKPLRS